MAQSILTFIPDLLRVTVDTTSHIASVEVYSNSAWVSAATVNTSNGQITIDRTATFNQAIQATNGPVNFGTTVTVEDNITLFTGNSYPGPDTTGPAGIGFYGRARIADWGQGWLLMGEPLGTNGGWAFGIDATTGAFATGTTDSTGAFTPRNYVDDGHRNMIVGGHLAVDQTADTTAGPTAGTVRYTSPLNGSAARKAIFYFNGYENDTTSAQSINYADAMTFTNPPAITANNTGLTVSASTSGIAVTAPDTTTLYTGWVIVSGF